MTAKQAVPFKLQINCILHTLRPSTHDGARKKDKQKDGPFTNTLKKTNTYQHRYTSIKNIDHQIKTVAEIV